jgi:hypothetical protein
VGTQSLLTGAILSHRAVWADTDFRPLSRGCEVPGTGDLLWYGRPRRLVGQTFYGDTHLCQGGGLPDARVIMMIMCVLVKELLCQGMKG